MTTRPSDGALWASVETTLRDVVLVDITDPFARLAVVQLIGLAHHARTRPEDPEAERSGQLAVALDALVSNSIVAARWPSDDTNGAAAAVLTAAVGRDDADAQAVRGVLRELLVAHLDADLAESSVLLGAFRGQVPRA